ncbi:MAG: hypothetical protein PVSMB7_18420 [Chloroflexota bacterium]
MLCLLGDPCIEVDGHVELLRLRPKAVSLLAYLALAERPVARRDLAQLFFPDAKEPFASLRWHLAYLRSTCPSSVIRGLYATREAVVLDVPTDVTLFRVGCERLRGLADAVDASTVLGFYRNDFLNRVSVSASPQFDTWLYIEQESLRRLFRQVTTGFARAVVGTPRVSETLEPLSRLVSVDPYCEDGHVLLIEAYETLERPEEARMAYDRYQRVVRGDLQAEPRPTVAARYQDSPHGKRSLPAEELVPLRDVTLHIVDWQGGEPPILAVHGSGMLAQSLDAIAEQIAPDHRFVSVDLRGHGLSDKPRTGYELERHVDDLVQLIGELGLQRPVLLGHSAGGAIAAFVATRADVSGLILLDGTIGDRAFTENAASRITPWIDHLDTRKGGFESYLAEWRARRPRWREESERMLDRWVHYLLAPCADGTYRPRVLREAIEAEWVSIVAADTMGELGRVPCPTLIVLATQPFMGGLPYLTRETAEAQLRTSMNGQLVLARTSSHGTLVRDPEPEMITAIVDFLGYCESTQDAMTVRNA